MSQVLIDVHFRYITLEMGRYLHASNVKVHVHFMPISVAF